MDKKEVQKRVLKNGKPLDLNLFEWDEKTSTFSTNMRRLIVYFKEIDFCTFITGNGCTFKTGGFCTFKTGHNCKFNTDDNCKFDTGSDCAFKTGNGCNFDTGDNCIFKTGHNCNFVTGHNCKFNTGDSCTFNANYSCTFKTGKECVVVRRDLYEIIELKEGVEIVLDEAGIKGYKTKKQKKELTMKELEKELGFEIKIVK